MKTKIVLLSFVVVFSILNSKTMAQSPPSDKLVVLWTSDDPLLAERMVLMYSHAAKKSGWFKEVTLISWGPSNQLIVDNKDIQEKVKIMKADGVVLESCYSCAKMYDLIDELKEIGFEVKGMGAPLTDYLKSDAKVLTF